MNSQQHSVLYVAHSLRMGGVEQLISRFAVTLLARGWRVHVATFLGGGILEQAVEAVGGTVHRLQKKEGLDVDLVLRLRRVIREQGIEVVHTNNYSPWLYAGVACLGLPVRLVHTEHSIVPGNLKRRFLAERMLSWTTDSVVAVSEDVRHKLLELTGIDRKKVHVVTNGVDVAAAQAVEGRRDKLRDEWQIPPGGSVFGTVGRLAPVKDQATMIKAFAQFQSRVVDARLVIVGDGELRTALENLVSSLKLTDKVIFLGQRQDAAQLMAGFDVFVMSSESEGMSVSILEAMAAGLPVIATNTGGNPELVQDAVTGFLVPVADPVNMANAMGRLASADALRAQLGAMGRRTCRECYSFESMLARYTSFYKTPSSSL